jgi:hypothetical protein
VKTETSGALVFPRSYGVRNSVVGDAVVIEVTLAAFWLTYPSADA